jgi:hypothetical protein
MLEAEAKSSSRSAHNLMDPIEAAAGLVQQGTHTDTGDGQQQRGGLGEQCRLPPELTGLRVFIQTHEESATLQQVCFFICLIFYE